MRRRSQGSSRLPHSPALRGGHLIRRVLPDTGLDLDGGDDAVDAHQEIDLAAARPQVAGEQSAAPAAEEAERGAFAERP